MDKNIFFFAQGEFYLIHKFQEIDTMKIENNFFNLA